MKYIAHIFDVDDNGAIITNTETVHKFSSETDDNAVLIAEEIRQSRDKAEPLKSGENYICNVWLLDENDDMIKQI